jgi:glutamate synthase (ferredoxin)
MGQAMGGGQIVVRPSLKSQLEVSNGVIVGDFALEEAYGGNLFVAGPAGDHFSFRNYGATAVVEGIGDFGCAEMTDGVVVVLGSIGKRFGAGMQGGSVFILNGDLPQSSLADAIHPTRVTEKCDLELLKYLVTRHVRLTGSIRGQEILDDWSSRVEQFWKIDSNNTAPRQIYQT